VVVPGATEDDAVTSRKHVTAAQIAVVDLRLRQQYLQLTTHRTKLLVVKQRARAKPGAVEHYRLSQSRDLSSAFELLYHNSATSDVEVAQQRAQIDRRLDQHRRVLLHKRKAKVVFRIAMNLKLRIEIVAARQLALE